MFRVLGLYGSGPEAGTGTETGSGSGAVSMVPGDRHARYCHRLSSLLTLPITSFGYLAWSKDSAYVYFDTVLSNDPGFFRLRVKDLKLEKMIDLTKTKLFIGQFGPAPWTGIGPGDVPLLPRDISTQEIYSFELQKR
jgi:hypothetical protein